MAKRFTECAGRVDEVVTRRERADPPVAPKVTGDVEAGGIAWRVRVCRRVWEVVVAATGEACGAHRGHPRVGPLHDRAGAQKAQRLVLT